MAGLSITHTGFPMLCPRPAGLPAIRDKASSAFRISGSLEPRRARDLKRDIWQSADPGVPSAGGPTYARRGPAASHRRPPARKSPSSEDGARQDLAGPPPRGSPAGSAAMVHLRVSHLAGLGGGHPW